jgi:hypothetical protein
MVVSCCADLLTTPSIFLLSYLLGEGMIMTPRGICGHCEEDPMSHEQFQLLYYIVRQLLFCCR